MIKLYRCWYGKLSRIEQTAELCVYNKNQKDMCMYNQFLKEYTENLMVVTVRNKGRYGFIFFRLYLPILFGFCVCVKCFEIQKHKCSV